MNDAIIRHDPGEDPEVRTIVLSSGLKVFFAGMGLILMRDYEDIANCSSR